MLVALILFSERTISAMKSQGRRLIALVLASALAGGCGSKSEGPEFAGVSGTVKYQGQPLENAQVVFIPDTAGAPPASGATDKNGYYRLMTRAPGDGAVVGKYRVTVAARGPDKILPEGQTATGLLGNTEPGDPLIPQKYFLPDTSGLTGEVKSGRNTIDFELSK
jgi:hypothetical protein